MILIQELKKIIREDFGIDQIISSFSATVTLLAFLATFGILIYNSKKEKREAEERSEKTLSLLDFIFETNYDDVKYLLETMKKVRENTTNQGIHEGYRAHYKTDVIEEWKKNRNPDLDIFFIVSTKDYHSRQLPTEGTRFEKNHIILVTYEKLSLQNFNGILKDYLTYLKINLENQHLNLTSESLGKIYDRIQAIKESSEIYESIKISDLMNIADYEKNKEEKDISEILGKPPLEIIKEEHEKLTNLENELKKVLKPFSGGVIK